MMRGVLAAAMLLGACRPEVVDCAGDPWVPRSIEVGENPFGPDDPLWAPQPHRDRPLEVLVDESRQRAWVSLQGTVDAPGSEVAIVDLEQGTLLGRVPTGGSSPTGMAMHPGGEAVVVLDRFTDAISVMDPRDYRIQTQLPTDFYAIEAAFSPDGTRLWLTNRWRDAVGAMDVSVTDGEVDIDTCGVQWVPVGSNPRDLAISDDGTTVAVAALTGLDVTLVDAETATVREVIDLGAPANGLDFVGDWLVVATTSAATHHLPLEGPDTDGDGHPGDGTPNVNFQDLNNELAVISADTAEVA